jgi:hypothetical protein
MKPSSRVPSQSSSIPLQISVGGVHVPYMQSAPQACVPVVPQLAVQLRLVPWQQPMPSSQAPLQSSSMPLQTSAGGEHASHPQRSVQRRLPAVPHAVTQLPVAPRQHVYPSSQPIAQSSSRPLQTSSASGWTDGLSSSQSSGTTPPDSGQVIAPWPSLSMSRVV